MIKSLKKEKPDFILLFSSFLLILIGLVALASACGPISIKLTGNSMYFLKHQIIFGLIPGTILLILFYKLKLDILRKISLVLFIFSIILCLAVFLPKIGSEVGGGTRWIKAFGMTFQPSELLKLSFILYLSAWIHKFKDSKEKFKTILIPFLIILGIIFTILYLQRDLGTLLVILSIGGIIYFTAHTPISHTGIIIGLVILGILFLIFFEQYRVNRLMVFLNPDSDPQGIGYHVKQSIMAIGSGGFLGKGIGLGEQKFGFLPEANTDSIFAIFGEEAGFVGTFSVMTLFMLFAWRGFKIAKEQGSEFLRSITIGITAWFIIQAIMNIGSMLGIMPLTGIPLTFLSYGSSAFICEMIAMGILLNISKK